MKSKTLVVIDNLHSGGVATSLYNYIKYTNDWQDCELLVFNEESINIANIPDNVKVIKPQKILHILGKCHSEIKQESLLMTFIRLVMIFIARRVNGVLARKIVWPFVKTIGDYDLALAYAQDDSWHSISKGCIDFVVKKVKARKRAVIVHCDYCNFGGYDKGQLSMFNKLDHIIHVSYSCKMSFDKCFPMLCKKSVVCENFTDVQGVIEKSEPSVTYEKDKVTIVSVCRLGEEKALERPILAIKKLVDEGQKIMSFVIVGGGPEEYRLKKMIEDYHLEAFIKMTGPQDNPYPYIKNATWFLLPSRHEAAPMVYGESAALGVPIITTDTCSAKELVEEKGWGFIVENSKNGVYEGMKRVTLNKSLRESFTVNRDGINKNAVSQFFWLIDIVRKEKNSVI